MSNTNHIYAQLDYINWEISRIDALVQEACEGIAPKCNATGYRTYNSECNNLGNRRWGAANIGFQRLLPSEYEDGVGDPKGGFTFRARTNRTLPSPRYLSQQITRANFKKRKQQYFFSDLFTAFGQFCHMT